MFIAITKIEPIKKPTWFEGKINTLRLRIIGEIC